MRFFPWEIFCPFIETKNIFGFFDFSVKSHRIMLQSIVLRIMCSDILHYIMHLSLRNILVLFIDNKYLFLDFLIFSQNLIALCFRRWFIAFCLLIFALFMLLSCFIFLSFWQEIFFGFWSSVCIISLCFSLKYFSLCRIISFAFVLRNIFVFLAKNIFWVFWSLDYIISHYA